jgi:hypothetical protein
VSGLKRTAWLSVGARPDTCLGSNSSAMSAQFRPGLRLHPVAFNVCALQGVLNNNTPLCRA